MFVARWRWVALGVLVMGAGAGTSRARAQAPLGPEGPPALEGPAPATGQGNPLLHEAFQAPGARADRVHVPKSPPPPIAERPTDDRPDPQAQWVSGYWAWDPSRDDFTWIAGAWRIPPRGMIWVGGRWMRDADGWYRVAGSWNPRQGQAAPPPPVPVVATVAVKPAEWRTNGPPAEHPDDTPGPAPDPDCFFVPGHYTPDGDRLNWTPGFWARMQTGWDWVPARWVRRPDGWDFREGYWTRDPANPPAVVGTEPAGTGRDLLAEAEANARAANPAVVAPVVVVPRIGPPIGYRYGVPMSVIRPPGAYPYGPAGVVVPAATPPFVQRLLNRVLP